MKLVLILSAVYTVGILILPEVILPIFIMNMLLLIGESIIC